MCDRVTGQRRACRCRVCGKAFERPVLREIGTSIVMQQAYAEECSVCDECRMAGIARAEVAYTAFVRNNAAYHLRRKRGKTAADVIQEYNLRHKDDKKGKHRK